MVLPASLNRNNEHVECGVVVGLWETVFVQYIRNPGYFVVQYERDIAKIEQMSVEIKVKCHGKPLRPVTDLQLGQFSVKLSHYLSVAAPRAWYRLPTILKLLRSTASFKKSFKFHAAYTENTV